MIEQTLEKEIMDAFSAELSAANVRIVGAWQPSADGVKGLENADAESYLAVRVSPRSYATPTIPTAQFAVTVSLITRAEIDADGQSYLDLTSKASAVLQTWQNDLQAAVDGLTVDGLDVAGFQLTGGDVGTDKANRLWTWTQSMIVYGIVNHG